jgi:hypothetical protein
MNLEIAEMKYTMNVLYLPMLARWHDKLVLGLLLLSGVSYATHLMGGEITYDRVGPNQYRITVRLYRDCGGIALENPIVLDYASSQCNVSASISFSSISVRDVTPLCPGGQSRCGGNGPYGW